MRLVHYKCTKCGLYFEGKDQASLSYDFGLYNAGNKAVAKEFTRNELCPKCRRSVIQSLTHLFDGVIILAEKIGGPK